MDKIIMIIIAGILQVFKAKINDKIAASKTLQAVYKWTKDIAAELQAFAEGKPLPPLDSGSAIIDSSAPFVLEAISSLKQVEFIMPIIDMISTNVLEIITDIDPDAAIALTQPPIETAKIGEITTTPGEEMMQISVKNAQLVGQHLTSISTIAGNGKNLGIPAALVSTVVGHAENANKLLAIAWQAHIAPTTQDSNKESAK